MLFQALVNGDIDIYPEYTGTITQELLAGEEIGNNEEIRERLAEQNVLMSEPLGFNNTYALGMRKDRAEELGIETTSDLLEHPGLVFGFGNEFMDRQDGWPNLRRHYRLPQTQVTGLDHDLAYEQLRLGSIDVIDVYTTDAKIAALDIQVLEDDLSYFPRYDAVLLYRADLDEKVPDALESMLQLEGEITAAEMIAANAGSVIDEESETKVASDFLASEFGFADETEVVEDSRTVRIAKRTLEHLNLVRKSLIPAILIGIPLGVFAAKRPRIGQGILAVVGIIQTIPSLALLVMLMPVMASLGLTSVGTGSTTAIVALLLYSLLPIVRNTHSGLQGIDPVYHESAAALGLPGGYRLMNIELPLASRSILAGIKTAAVINVGFATLGALIGAGGYGQPILTGIRLSRTDLILEGAIPAAVLAVVAQIGFEIAEAFFVPRGLRLESKN